MQGKLLLLLFAMLSAACTAQAQKHDQAERLQAMDRDWRLAFQVDGGETVALNPDDKVRFVFRLHNDAESSRAFSFTFPPHRVAVINAAGTTVWEAHSGMMFPQVMRNQRVEPGEFAEFTAEWNPDGDAAPGEYTIQAEFNAFADDGAKLALPLPTTRLRLENE